MERDMDLVKDILIKLEHETPGTTYNSENFEVAGYNPLQVHYHVFLMEEAGLIRALDVTGMNSPGPEMIPVGLTWDGCEFLDLARSESIWNKARTTMSERGVGMTLDVLKALLSHLAREAVGLGN